MSHNKTKGIIALLVGVAIPIVLILAMYTYSVFKEPLLETEVPAAGVVLSEVISPDSSLLANVTATKKRGVYDFMVIERSSGKIVKKKTIIVPVAYHAHLVSLKWNKIYREVKAIVNHDFGEGNIEVSLKY